MLSVRTVLAAVVCFALGARAPRATAQEPAPAPPYIGLGQVDASPGASVIVPLYFTPDPNKGLSAFTAEIEFVSNNLIFEDASKGVVNEGELKVSHSLAASEPDDKGVKRSRVRLSVSLDGKSKRGLEEGLVAYLLFNLSPEAKPFVIKLNPKIISAEDAQKPARKVLNLAALAGSVSVLSSDVTPEMSCFFFTH